MIYTLSELRQEYQKGNQYKFLFFWGHTPSADGSVGVSCFSQWWMQDFEIDAVTYCCAEQYMMAEKARLFGDDEMFHSIMGTSYPKEMKAYGRAVKNFDKEVWEQNCYRIVKTASRAKFSQNQELLEFLMNTGKRILVEASPRDRIWGIGMGRSNPDAEDPMKWRGRNMLGFALTQARDELTEELKKS